MKEFIICLLPILVSACGGSKDGSATDHRPLLEVSMDDIKPGKTICADEPALMFEVVLTNASDSDLEIQELHFLRSGTGSSANYGFWGFNGKIIREGIVDANAVIFPLAPFAIPAGASKPIRFWLQAHPSNEDGEHVFSLPGRDSVLSVPDARVDGDFPLAGNPVIVSATTCQ